MILGTNFQEALRSLLGARQRTLLALIGIVIGIGSVIGMVSIGTIVQHEALNQFREMGLDIVMVRQEFGEGKRPMQLQDVRELPAAEQTILGVAPFMGSGLSYRYGGQEKYLEMMGVTESFFSINKLRPSRGRFLSDLDTHRHFCVIGAEIAGFLRKQGVDPLVGATMALGERIFTVVGVLQPISSGGGLRPGNINTSVLMPISTAQRTFQKAELRSFMARIREGVPPEAIRRSIQGYFATRNPGLGLRVQTAEELIQGMQKQMRLFTLLLGAIGSIALIVGGIGVMNVMLISVTERRREIGLRRALGAQQGDIMGQFIIESVALCLVGGLIGIVLGVGVSYAFARFSHWTFLLSWPAVLMGVGVATAVGVFFGFYPARTAARLDPIKALRS
jgi:putative ABC transport system permease protein